MFFDSFRQPHLRSSQTSFFFNDPAPTEIYTLSLHDALPISRARRWPGGRHRRPGDEQAHGRLTPNALSDRKSTRLNSSHTVISYAVFCLKKKIKDVVSRRAPLRGNSVYGLSSDYHTDNILLF